jgi:dTDP-4-amino-4,6-dideoxygalactose transaminase
MAVTQLKVPYVDLARQHAPLKGDLLAAAGRVIDRGNFILGAEVAEFERRFADLCGTADAVGVSSGGEALALSLKVLGIGNGDEVISAPNSFVGSASSIALTGAKPVFADVDDSFNLDPAKVEAAITPRTKALMPIHLTGRPADMERLTEIAGRFHLYIIEDAAQAVLAARGGKRVGAWGTTGCFSLHPLKTLNALGDAGVITTDDQDLADRLRVLRNFGLRTRDECAEWSTNSRLDTLQAAMLLVKLDRLEAWTERRRANAAYYFEKLSGLPGLKLPFDRPGEYQVHHTFVIRSQRRDELKAFLAARGVGSSIHYPIPIHLQPAAKSLGYKRGDFPVAERQAAEILSLPIHHDLEQHELAYVAQCVTEFFEQTS